MSEFNTMYHDAFAKAFFIETPGHERLAIFPYGGGRGDLPLIKAKEAALKALDFFNGQTNAQTNGQAEAQAEDTCENCASLNGERYCEMKKMLIGMRYSPACEVFKRKGEKGVRP